VLTRRYQHLKNDETIAPDIIVIDGGRGQLNKAKAVLSALNRDQILIIGIAKGEGRKPGLETLWINDDQTALQLPAHSAALHLLQHIRDEAHRFAILKHRAKRQKNRRHSPLENMNGIGTKKRQQLLNFFGGMQELQKASVQELQKVPGIGLVLAQKIHNNLHQDLTS
jgi:excinuclease ABC subunit C